MGKSKLARRGDHPVVVHTNRVLDNAGRIGTAATILGIAGSLASGLYLGLREWVASADPTGAIFLIVSMTILVAGLLSQAVSQVGRWFVEFKKRQTWPVTLLVRTVSTEDTVLVGVHARDRSEEMKVVVTWGPNGGHPELTTPYSIPWKDDDSEYHHVPRRSTEWARLCDYGMTEEPWDVTSTRTSFDFSYPAYGKPSSLCQVWFSTFFSGDDNKGITDSGFRVAVVGRNSGLLRDFFVRVRATELTNEEHRQIKLEAVVSDAGPNGAQSESVRLLYDSEHLVWQARPTLSHQRARGGDKRGGADS